MADYTSILTGAGIIGLIAAFWDKIRFVFHRLFSLVFIRVIIDDHRLVQALMLHFWKNFRRSFIADRRYASTNDFVKPLGRYIYLAYEELGRDPFIFWKGWRPISAGMGGMINYGGNETNDPNEGKLTLMFIRGFWDIDKLIVEALKNYNSLIVKKDGGRFYVKRIVGSLMGKVSKDMAEAESDSSEPRVDKQDRVIFYCNKRLLRWTLKELGQLSDENKNPLDLLALPPDVMDVVSDLKFWIQSEKWYKDRSIPWKRGILLHGQPGTGKTALTRAVAEELDLPVWSYDLATLSNMEFVTNWEDMLTRVPCIALIEDIDTVFEGRKNITRTDFSGGLTFDCLLNCIDGIKQAEGVILVITTNYLDKLDQALGVSKYISGNGIIVRNSTRPGRIDKVVAMEPLDENCRRKLASRILVEWPETHEDMVREGEGETGAQFQDRCAREALARYWNNSKLKGGKGRVKNEEISESVI